MTSLDTLCHLAQNLCFSVNHRNWLGKMVVYFSDISEGFVTFERRALTKVNEVNWENSSTTFTDLRATANGSIESDGAGMLQVPVLIILALFRCFDAIGWVTRRAVGLLKNMLQLFLRAHVSGSRLNWNVSLKMGC